MTSCKKETAPQNNINSTNIVPFTEVGNQMKAQSQATAEQQTSSANPINNNQVKGSNPAHGQPDHRCDIPVGAPLNTPAVANSQQNTAVTSTPTTATPAQTTPTADRMNPPHGQANHRCEIAVGSPLPKE